MAAETSQTLDRGLTVLELLSGAEDGMTVTEIAASLGVSRTVVYRLVVTLEQHALLRRSADGRCRLGLALLGLARQVQPLLRDAALPALRRLAESTDATACLTVVDGSEVVIVALVEPSRPETQPLYRLGSRYALDRAATGRAVLALRAGGGQSPEPAWVVSRGELHPGVTEVAASLVGVSGIEASVAAFASRELPVDELGPKVVRAAGDVARALR